MLNEKHPPTSGSRKNKYLEPCPAVVSRMLHTTDVLQQPTEACAVVTRLQPSVPATKHTHSHSIYLWINQCIRVYRIRSTAKRPQMIWTAPVFRSHQLNILRIPAEAPSQVAELETERCQILFKPWLLVYFHCFEQQNSDHILSWQSQISDKIIAPLDEIIDCG